MTQEQITCPPMPCLSRQMSHTNGRQIANEQTVGASEFHKYRTEQCISLLSSGPVNSEEWQHMDPACPFSVTACRIQGFSPRGSLLTANSMRAPKTHHRRTCGEYEKENKGGNKLFKKPRKVGCLSIFVSLQTRIFTWALKTHTTGITCEQINKEIWGEKKALLLRKKNSNTRENSRLSIIVPI